MTGLPRTRRHRRSRVLLGLCLLLPLHPARGAEPLSIAMTADRWQSKGNVEFVRMEGFPLGLLRVNDGGAVLKNLHFANGTIEFDIQPIGQDIPGIRFRRRDDATAEEFYLRPGPNCPASDDCVQYAPVTHGLMLWDIYPEYQAGAPLREDGWNHIRLVISGRRMDVFVNRATSPVLAVGRLEGDALEGGLQLDGPANFANLTVARDAVDGLSPQPAPDPAAADIRLVRNWQVSTAATLPIGHDLAYAEMPAGSSPWNGIVAERYGLVNLSRRYGSPTGRGIGAVAWLKTSIDSDHDQTRRVSIGWAREVWVFVNGKPSFAGNNLYYPESARKSPDGRLSLENGSFDLPLRKGRNQIAIALGNDFPGSASHWGWGMELRLDDLDGIKLLDGDGAIADRP